MECRDVRRLADAYLSGQLLVETSQSIGSHLDTCPSCRAEVHGLRRLRAGVQSAFRSATDEPMRPEFTAALRDRLRAHAVGQPTASTEPATPVPPTGQVATTVRRPSRSWLALAAAALLAVVAGLGVQQWGARAWTALVLAAAGDHQNCALTFALTEDPIPLEEAAARFGGAHQLLATLALPTATVSGVPLQVVERHSCLYGGERFVHLVMRYKGETVSVLVTDDPRPRLASIGRGADGVLGDIHTEGAFTVTSFTSGQNAAFVVSALGPQDLRDVAEAVAMSITRALAGA